MAQQIVVHIETVRPEPGLAVRQIEAPQADEALRIAKCSHLWQDALETLQPACQRARIVLTETVILHHRQPGLPGLLLHDRRRRQHAAWKHMALNEVRATPI